MREPVGKPKANAYFVVARWLHAYVRMDGRNASL